LYFVISAAKVGNNADVAKRFEKINYSFLISGFEVAYIQFFEL